MNTSSVSIPVITDMLVEGRNELFNFTLKVPQSLGPAITAGGRNRAKGIIIDTTSECVKCNYNISNALCRVECGV